MEVCLGGRGVTGEVPTSKKGRGGHIEATLGLWGDEKAWNHDHLEGKEEF